MFWCHLPPFPPAGVAGEDHRDDGDAPPGHSQRPAQGGAAGAGVRGVGEAVVRQGASLAPHGRGGHLGEAMMGCCTSLVGGGEEGFTIENASCCCHGWYQK